MCRHVHKQPDWKSGIELATSEIDRVNGGAMGGCKHYSDVTDRHIKILGAVLETKFDEWGKLEPHVEIFKDLKIDVVYDPLKKVLKVSLKEKPNGLQEAHIWRILDELLTYGKSLPES